MKNKLHLIFLFLIGVNLNAQIQKDTTNYIHFSNFNLELGTSLIYSSAVVNYETESILKFSNHTLKFNFGGGTWVASIFTTNFGFLVNANLIYLYGTKAHFFELDLGASAHFSKGTNTEYGFQNVLPNLFLGYRYQGVGEKVMFKAGIGAIELFQIGIGYSIQ